MINERSQLESIIVSAEQMRQIEGRILAAGMPVAALMEKAAGLAAARIQALYPQEKFSQVGILVGPGHNGGDALVVARELYLQGYQVLVYSPFPKLKELTRQQANYAASLGIPFVSEIRDLSACHLLVDGLFGFGLERSLSGQIAEEIAELNQWQKTIVSIDIASGLHTDTGAVLGVAVSASLTLCLGLWKLAFFQDRALAYLGEVERIDFGIPPADVWAILGKPAARQKITAEIARKFLPLPRPLLTHKYQQGHLLLICGSRRYAGGAVLTGLGARNSGVGMLSIAVPESLKPILVNQLPEALIIACPETTGGAIASLPPLARDFAKYSAIACGPGLTLEAETTLRQVLEAQCPLILDADGLNILAQSEGIVLVSSRKYPTILTPHLGEFKRLFPHISDTHDRISAVQQASTESKAIVLLKGARTAIATPSGECWLISESTPALARGGSGDVLTGLIGGLIAQRADFKDQLGGIVGTSAYWHAQAGIIAARERTDLGVDALSLTQYLSAVV